MRRRQPAGPAAELPAHLRTLSAFRDWYDAHPERWVEGWRGTPPMAWRDHLASWALDRGCLDPFDDRRPDWHRLYAMVRSWGGHVPGDVNEWSVQ